MPRQQPPAGYYTSTEVKKILNISGGMIANYVEKGRIKHVVPPGRIHGFYLKKDVDKLAEEINAFFALDDEADAVTLAFATEADITGCIALNKELFPDIHAADEDILKEKWRGWIQKNPEIISILKQDQKVRGIITMIPHKPNSARFQQVLRADTSILLGNVDILPADIEEYTPGNHIELYVAEIGIQPSLDKNLRRKYGAKLIARAMGMMVDLGAKGVIVERVTSVGASKSGVRLLQHFGFSEVVFERSDTRMFELDILKSGAPVAISYRKAFEESTQ